jgi:hypothetical protein
MEGLLIPGDFGYTKTIARGEFAKAAIATIAVFLT